MLNTAGHMSHSFDMNPAYMLSFQSHEILKH